MTGVIDRIVDRCHISESNLHVIKYVISRMAKGYKTFKKLSKDDRKTMLKIIVKRHTANKKLYLYVMGG